MKKHLTRIVALLLCAVIVASSSITARAEGSYTYIYDYWGDVQDCPDFYTVNKVYTSTELELEKKLNNPQGLFASGNLLYLCDTGNNRIIEIERTAAGQLVVNKIIEEIKGSVDNKKFSAPTDIAVSEDGNFFIADSGNARILKVDSNFNYIMEFSKPVDSVLEENASFIPTKIVVDTAERVYCIASGINKGLLKYEADGTFAGFFGATPAVFVWYDYIWKKFASQEQRARMASFVPTEYDNAYMDHEGFIYAVVSKGESEDFKAEKIDAVRKLNLLGADILVRNGEWPVYGDIYMGTGGGCDGSSKFTDVTVFNNDIYCCLDRNRGRVFGYDDQGRMVFGFGGKGNMDGYFRSPSSIEHIDHDLYVVDSLDCAITVFIPTEFGSLVFEAMDSFDDGDYEASSVAWRQVMNLDGNYDLAYIGIGRSLLREKKYEEALKYFELKYDDENYSKAYKQYRKIWVEQHIVPIVIILLVLFLVPMAIGKVKSLKEEIEKSDAFK